MCHCVTQSLVGNHVHSREFAIFNLRATGRGVCAGKWLMPVYKMY